jgi:GNAT superfamily N-acetyltransferase
MSGQAGNTLIIKDTDPETVAQIHALIPDFGDHPDPDHFRARCAGHDFIMLAAWRRVGSADIPAGYVVAYDRYEDGSFYCWMAGTVPTQRGGGVLTALMTMLEDRARARGYTTLRIRTRNRWTAMLRWLIGHSYAITAVDKRAPLADSRVDLIKHL